MTLMLLQYMHKEQINKQKTHHKQIEINVGKKEFMHLAVASAAYKSRVHCLLPFV